MAEMKYVVVTGGVVSGLGKGVTASSIGLLLKSCGLRVTSIKIDPYLNMDAGTMSPFEHGEVFVLDDGGEVDLDLGNYERFLDVTLTRENNITSGKIYQAVLENERRGDYLGKTVQIVPHLTDVIQDRIQSVAKVPVDGTPNPPDVCVIELGGVVGTLSHSLFQALLTLGSPPPQGTLNPCHLLRLYDSSSFTLVLKTFATFTSALSQFLVLSVNRRQSLLSKAFVKFAPSVWYRTYWFAGALKNSRTTPKRSCPSIAMSWYACVFGASVSKTISPCIQTSDILNIYDVSNIWHVPLILRDQEAHYAVLSRLNLSPAEPCVEKWSAMARSCENLTVPVRIAVVGKYTGLADSYLSVLKGLQHACIACSRRLLVDWVASSSLEDAKRHDMAEEYESAWSMLKDADGILIPGGFGARGVQGMILAAKYARENNVPFLGLCLGMQVAVIEFSRSVLNLENANSTEFDPATPYPCVVFMPEVSDTHKGGTMRLGSRATLIQTPHCITAKLYQKETHIYERHRHRYEVNPQMVEALEGAGLCFVARDETGRRMEIMELPSHPFYVGVQFHPEFKSRPGKPSPLFIGFIQAASGQMNGYIKGDPGTAVKAKIVVTKRGYRSKPPKRPETGVGYKPRGTGPRRPPPSSAGATASVPKPSVPAAYEYASVGRRPSWLPRASLLRLQAVERPAFR
ncbi:CTP synthase 2 isoform X1 [Selaginella moellendorffii]|uniref:CTP synthase 2 isoform X1 n=1 Tax=Selaginella moellendorffii TaxID=88036 RepID=UPI000D1CBF54|nr:CTP synthase 2 isoform X1 [Selaginella moellendorffii]|eukprot:XP_024538769.1 CTP synthase 2 isoform X1 [Selaginella moellendorffii]